MRKYLVVVASLIMQTCLGGIYAWSVFVPPLQRDYGLSNAQTQLLFGLTVGVLTLSMPLTGPLQDRRGPRVMILISALCYAGGYLLASASGGSFPLLAVGISLLGGIAIASGYVAPLATCVKWFPSRPGLMTGVAVVGYGAGAIVLTALAEHLLARGWSVLEIFRALGIGYGGILALCALALAVPPGYRPAVATHLPPVRGLARQREFWALFVSLFAGTLAGIVVIGNLKPLGLSLGLTPAVAAVAISTLALGNAAGRLAGGILFDRWGRLVILGALLLLALSVGAMPLLRLLPVGLMALAAVVGFGYGACLVLHAARVTQHWGAHRLGKVYPLVFLGHGAAAVLGPGLAGALADATGAFILPLLLGAVVSLLGAGALWALRPAPAPPPEVCEPTAGPWCPLGEEP